MLFAFKIMQFAICTRTFGFKCLPKATQSSFVLLINKKKVRGHFIITFLIPDFRILIELVTYMHTDFNRKPLAL